MDMVAGGPVVREASDEFDHFWNSDWAMPIKALVDRPSTEANLRAPGHMIFDDPDEIKTHWRTTTLTEGFRRRIDHLNSELLMEAPYFVLTERRIANAKRLHERGAESGY